MFFRDLVELSSEFSQLFYSDDGFEVWGGFPDGFKSQGRLEVSNVDSSLRSAFFQDRVRNFSGVFDFLKF